MNKTQAGRLLTLAWFLKTEVPRSKFNMNVWGVVPYGSEKEYGLRLCDITRPDEVCGTSACALGWAASVWPRVFSLRFPNTDYTDSYAQVRFRGKPLDIFHEPGYWESRTTQETRTAQSAREFFGITADEADGLFGQGDSTPKQKAAQIESLVASHGWVYEG